VPEFWKLWFRIMAMRGARYTVRFPDAIYVLHVFQKKSTKVAPRLPEPSIL